MMKILCTGGAGFIGSILVPELLSQGYHVTVLDNFIYHQNSLANICYHPNFEVIRGDTRDEQLVKQLVQKVDTIIPLAALVGAPACNQNQNTAHTTNFRAIVMMTRHLSTQQRILIPTSNSGYGLQEPGITCTEDMSLTPTSFYGVTKVRAEKIVMTRENSISFRLATVFGMSPRMRFDLLVNDFVYRAVNDHTITLFEANYIRNYIHIQDVARVFLHGIKNFDDLKGEIYNVGMSDANLSKLEICKIIKKHLPIFSWNEDNTTQHKDPDQRNYIVSNSKIESTIFYPVYSIDDGITELIKGCEMLRNTRYGNI